MSSVYRRADGRWCASAVIDGQRKTVYGRTRKEVEQRLQHLLQQPVSQETIASFLQRWLDQVVRHHNSPRTHHSYAERVRLDLIPHIGHYHLSELSPEHIQTMLTDLLERGLSPRTVQYDHSILRRALNQAVEWELLKRNPTQRARPPRVERHEVTPLTVEQARALLNAASGDRLEVLYRVALSLGLRQGEILALKWTDIDAVPAS